MAVVTLTGLCDGLWHRRLALQAKNAQNFGSLPLPPSLFVTSSWSTDSRRLMDGAAAVVIRLSLRSF